MRYDSGRPLSKLQVSLVIITYIRGYHTTYSTCSSDFILCVMQSIKLCDISFGNRFSFACVVVLVGVSNQFDFHFSSFQIIVMCCSRKYQYLSHRRNSWFEPLPLLLKFLFSYILSFKKIGL